MKKRLLFSMIIVALLALPSSRSFAKMDILREIDEIVDASKPNVLIIMSTGKFMSRAYNISSGNPTANVGDTDTSSRFYMVKDVLRDLSGDFDGGILTQTEDVIDYGFMAYDQEGYFPYMDCNGAACDGNENPAVTETTHVGATTVSGGTTYYYPDYSEFANGKLIEAPASNEPQHGKLWAPIGTSVDTIKSYLDLQNDGGIVIDGESTSDSRGGGSFYLVDNHGDYDSANAYDADGTANNAYTYFNEVIIPADTPASNGCFSKNYIIYVTDGWMSSGLKGEDAAFAGARKLLQLTSAGVGTPVKTFVIGVIDKAGMSSQRTRLNKIAFMGGTDASDTNYGLIPSLDANLGGVAGDDCTTDGSGSENCYLTLANIVDGHDYAFFATNPDEIYEAFNNIVEAIAAGDYVTGAPSATSSGSTYVTNDIGILPSAEYPSWRGHLRAVDLVNDEFWWDAGTTLFVPAAVAILPWSLENAAINTTDPSSIWRDTDGDGTIDQPPYQLTYSGGDYQDADYSQGSGVYQYTNKVLYCVDGSDCNSSDLLSYKYIGSAPEFRINGVNTTYNYVGAFYLKPYTDRKIYTSDVDGSLLEIDPSNATTLATIKTLAGWDDGSVSDEQAKAYLYFGAGALDSDADGSIDTGVDLNEDGDTDDTTNDGIDEATATVAREWWLGDITNIVPVTVGAPIEPEDGLSRSTFQSDFADRTNNPVVYTGSNDGMLHAYNFYTGNEVFAYIPPNLLSKLKTLYDNAVASRDPASFTGQEANPTDHIYGVASSPKVNDVWIDSDGTGASWHTVLVSGEGPGGSHYFALDITHPHGDADYNGALGSENRYSSNAQTLGAPFDILWHTQETTLEANHSYSTSLGETWSVPAYGRVNDGTDKWVVFVGSGYDDTNAAAGYKVGRGTNEGEGEVYHIISVEDGALLESVPIDSSGAPSVQYGLVPDSVSIIKKTSSRVRSSYQLDLEGRVNHITTNSSSTSDWISTDLITTLAADTDYVLPTINNPFYYSPAVWDFDEETDDANNLMAFGSGSYDDDEQDNIANSDTLYFALVKPGTDAISPVTPEITDAISVNIDTISGTRVNSDGEYIDSDGEVVATAETHTISSDSRLLASPVLFKNTTSNNLEALFLIFDPPTSGTLGCSFGGSYLLVFNLGSYSTFEGSTAADIFSGPEMAAVAAGEAQNVVSVGTGKVSGIGMAGGSSHAVVGESGHGTGSTAGFNIAGGNTWTPVGDTTKLYWKQE